MWGGGGTFSDEADPPVPAGRRACSSPRGHRQAAAAGVPLRVQGLERLVSEDGPRFIATVPHAGDVPVAWRPACRPSWMKSSVVKPPAALGRLGTEELPAQLVEVTIFGGQGKGIAGPHGLGPRKHRIRYSTATAPAAISRSKRSPRAPRTAGSRGTGGPRKDYEAPSSVGAADHDAAFVGVTAGRRNCCGYPWPCLTPKERCG